MKAVLQENLTLHHLDLSNNRIHPPALFELIQGLESNKTIASLKVNKHMRYCLQKSSPLNYRPLDMLTLFDRLKLGGTVA